MAAQLDAARQGMQSISRDSTLKIASFFRSPEMRPQELGGLIAQPTTPARQATSPAADGRRSADAIRRLKALPAGSYLNEGELSTPARRDGKGGVSP